MAALNLKEDQATGQLILEPRLLPRLAGLLGNLGWILVLAIFILVPSLIGGRVNPESLVVFLIILVFSLSPVVSSFFATSVTIDRLNHLLSRTTRLLFLPIRSTSFSFHDLANIEVQYYRTSSRRRSGEAYRVNAVDRAGSRIALNWDGKRDEMFELAQKISAMTGAPLLDQTAQAASTLDQVIEIAKNLGLPMPQEAASPTEPSTTSTQEPSLGEISVDVTPEGEEPIAIPATAAGEGSPILTHQDLHSLSVSELEQRVAGDPTDSDARYALARKYHARGELDRAISTYQATLQTDTSNAEAQNDLGAALQQRGNRKEAEAAYRRAIALDPFSFNAHLNLGLLLRSMNRAAEASQEFFQARRNARGEEETRVAEAASTGARVEPQLNQR